MTSSSHLAAAAVTCLGYAAIGETPVTVPALALTAVGSLLPDLDTPTSTIGRPVFPLARWINERWGHRTLTHSLIGLALFALMMLAIDAAGVALDLWPADLAGWLILGFASHLLVDTLNKTGIELFWPSRLRCVFFLNERCRIAASGTGDYVFLVSCVVLSLALYPVARDGFNRTLHRWFGDLYSVALDYRQYGDRNRIWMDFEGVDKHSNQKVAGRFEVLGVLENQAVLVERDGRKLVVSRTEPYHLYPDRTTMVIGEPVEVEMRELDMGGRTLRELPIPAAAARIQLFGYLTPVKFIPVSMRDDRYNAVTHQLDKLRLKHADWREISAQGLEDILISEGSLTLRITRLKPGPAGPDAPPNAPDASDSARPHHPEIRSAADPNTAAVTPTGPSSEEGIPGWGDVPGGVPGRIRAVLVDVDPDDEILIAPGDRVEYGQVIARRRIQEQLAQKRLSRERERLRLDRTRQELEQALADLNRDLAAAGSDLAELDRRCSHLDPLQFPTESARCTTRRTTIAASADKSLHQLRETRFKLDQLERERSVTERLEQADLDALEARAEVPAPFAGTILKLAWAEKLEVLYREGPKGNL